MNLANAITLLRFALVPWIALALWRRDDGLAFGLVLLSAASDFADGQVARRWQQQTRFGAVADPLADKLTQVTVTLLLTVQGSLPWWFTAAVVGRDLVIVGGALAYHRRAGHVEMAPTRLSKLNTGLQFAVLAAVMAVRAGVVGEPGAMGGTGAVGGSVGGGVVGGAAADLGWLDALVVLALATTVASGVQYVHEWGSRARRLPAAGTGP